MRYDLKEILDLGEVGGFAVPAFNVYNLETVLGVMKAAEETGAPVIFQMYSRLFDSEIAQYVAPIIREAMDNLKTPAAFHLDHGAGVPEVLRAFRYGATGVMIDASKKPIEENIAITRNVVQMAAEMGVTVEGELGEVGKAAEGVSTDYTKVEDAARFVEETGVCALAVAVGTAHGHYKQAPVLINGVAKPGYGGGTCQVSSTLYNALLQLPGIEILQRRPHGPGGAKYLPHGVDAAVGNENLNLRFRNDYDFPIRVEGHSSGDGALLMVIYRVDE